MKKVQRLFKLSHVYFIVDKQVVLDICGYDFDSLNSNKMVSAVETDKYHFWNGRKDFEDRSKLFRIRLK